MRSEIRNEIGNRSTILVGGPGTAKTSVILMFTSKFNSEEKLVKMINFSSATTPRMYQQAIEGEIDRKQGKTYTPPGGKRMFVFIDDMSMPQVKDWGDQTTLEITRQLIDQSGFYFLEKDCRGDFKTVENLQFLGAMNHPGGGRNDIPNRIKRQFFLINMTSPSQKSIENIYGQILGAIVSPKKYSEEIIDTKNLMIESTIHLWNLVKRKLLPTPAKFHYVFNMRELSRVFQGFCQTAQMPEEKVFEKSLNMKEKIPSGQFIMQLWRHECLRVFEDKLINQEDKDTFRVLLDKVTIEKFKEYFNMEDEDLKTDQLFADFQREDEVDEYGDLINEAPFVYEAISSIEDIRAIVYERMATYNEKNQGKEMSLVIFDDALRHLLRLARIIGMPRGSALLVGVGGSGKQSLTKLASSICKYKFFQISLTKSYGEVQLKDDIRERYTEAGPMGLRGVAFILTDAEIKSENFLEYINSFLSTGEIAGLIPKEDKDVISLEMKTVYMKEIGKKGEDPSILKLWKYFINRVRDCLHIILSFSPVGAKFRERARKFPSLFSSCTIDWFLPWPEEALVSVSKNFLGSFDIETGGNDEIKTQLEFHMGKVHRMVTEVCTIYLGRMRRHVYVTPKSYLSFINLYKDVYRAKFDELFKEESNIRKGLEKLKEAAEGIEILKKNLEIEKKEQAVAAEKMKKLMDKLKIENVKADKKSDEVAVVKKNCEDEAAKISIEKSQAEDDLAVAMPFLEKAVQAAESIQKKDVQEMGSNSKPVDTVKMIMDTVNIITSGMMDPITIQPKKIGKFQFEWLADSFENHCKATLKGNLMKLIEVFSDTGKDKITDETCELLEPYLFLKLPGTDDEFFNPGQANKASKALGGICMWCRAMYDYHNASKIVKPKLLLLQVKEASLKVALAELAAAEAELEKVMKIKADLQGQFDEAQADARALEEKAIATKRKMDQANKLINGLEGNKSRWIHDADNFKTLKLNLVGDVAKACAFVSYCGPFNSEFREKLLEEYFHNDLNERNIPVSQNLDLINFLVSQSQIGEWNLEGLPTDLLSIQNAIMVTKSSRFPLLIDPQGQAGDWIKNREKELLELELIYNINNPRLKDLIKLPIDSGYPLLIEGIENEVDPMFDPILEKQIIVKGRKKQIDLGGDDKIDWSDDFKLFMTTRLANPHFSPELAAKTTIIDFTVTQSGLEQQLLGRVLSKEQKSLEEQMNNLIEEITMNRKTLSDLDKQLLERLANSEGSLLEDAELMEVLNVIKNKSQEVNQKLKESDEKTIEINEKREQFRPVAARGSVLYFCIVEMSNVSWMYNTSLQQFLGLFDWSIDNAEAAQLLKDRVENIINTLTYKVYRYISRGLFEKDKVTYKIMICMKELINSGMLEQKDVEFFLKAGASVEDRNKQFSWMEQKDWLNIKALSAHRFGKSHAVFFKDLVDRIARNEGAWQQWINEDEPENIDVPDINDKIGSEQISHFIHLCLIRCVREDRTLLAANHFIHEVLGAQYTAPNTDPIQEIWEESAHNLPVLFLLSAGADPTGSIDEFAKKKKKYPCAKVSMGEEQEKLALKEMKDGFVAGTWVILQNCHLGLEFMAEIEEILNSKDEEIHPDFRLWITCQPHDSFPLSLLQLAIKVTNEPPKGLQAGLFRTFSTMINPDFLEKVEPLDKWRAIVYSTCFLHSIVQERRKFGPLGFCIGYEFNNSDLEASLNYVEKHFNFCQIANINHSWKAMSYMICEVQYGGRITDNLDREMFNAYGELWFHDGIYNKDYVFNHQSDFKYAIPDSQEHSKFMEYINNEIPSKDNPKIFGLHPNADLTFRLKESVEMITTLTDTQPKDSSGSSGKSPEQEVREKIENEMLGDLPNSWNRLEMLENLKKMKGAKGMSEVGLSVPLNIFLRQEMERFLLVLDIVRQMMNDIILAIEGSIIMTPELVNAIEAIYDVRVPTKWQYDPTGVEISWMIPTLGSWLKGLKDRYHQLNQWYTNGRPPSYWLTGFFNPQGFLTAMKQEVTRQQKGAWSLDDVVYKTDVKQEIVKSEDGRLDPSARYPNIQDGVLIHGLYMEGAGWDIKGGHIKDSEPKQLFFKFPMINVSATSTAPDTSGMPNQMPRGRQEDKSKDNSSYECPVYKYTKRNDKYLIFRVKLKGEGSRANAQSNKQMTPKINWKLKGVCLLCSKD